MDIFFYNMINILMDNLHHVLYIFMVIIMCQVIKIGPYLIDPYLD